MAPLRRIIPFLAFFAAPFMAVIIVNQTLQLSEFGARIHPRLGDALFWGILWALVISLAVPVAGAGRAVAAGPLIAFEGGILLAPDASPRSPPGVRWPPDSLPEERLPGNVCLNRSRLLLRHPGPAVVVDGAVADLTGHPTEAGEEERGQLRVLHHQVVHPVPGGEGPATGRGEGVGANRDLQAIESSSQLVTGWPSTRITA